MEKFLKQVHNVLAGLGIREGRMLPWGPTTRDGKTHHKQFHNASFYLGDGRFIGWGDLSFEDVQSIQERLPKRIAFCIVEESQMRELKALHGKDVLPEDLASHTCLIIKGGNKYLVGGVCGVVYEQGMIDTYTTEGLEKVKNLLGSE